MILEEREHALKRGAKIYAEVIGYAANGDAHHMTAPSPDGEGAARCMRLALKDAGIAPGDVDYINAHGTSTEYNDANETTAIKAVFGEQAAKLAEADAFSSLAIDRRAALWQALGQERRTRHMPLLSNIADDEPPAPLPPLPLVEQVFADYRTSGLSLKAHPVGFFREQLNRLRVTPAGELEKIRDDELSHVALLEDCLRKLGGDPTSMTPSADTVGVLGMGLVQVLTDPRSTFTQALKAMLVAELADNDSWDMLADLADKFGQTEMGEQFALALEVEEQHLASVRMWLQKTIQGQAGVYDVENPVLPSDVRPGT